MWAVPQEDVLIIYNNDQEGWIPLQPGLTSPPGTDDNFGPELSFGRGLADGHPTCGNVAIIKKSKGGKTLAVDWYPGIPHGPQYNQLLALVEVALQDLEQQGYIPVLEGMIWMQGESDAKTEDYALAYQENLELLISDLREDLGVPQLPFVIGRIHDQLPIWKYPFADTVRAAQVAVADETPSTRMISTDGLGIKSDSVHFDGPGQIVLGEEFAQEIIDIGDPASVPFLGALGRVMTAAIIATEGKRSLDRKSQQGSTHSRPV